MRHSLGRATAMLGTRVLTGAALLSALVLALAGLDVGPVTSRAIAPAEIRHQGGHAYYIDVTPAASLAPSLVTTQPDSTGTPRSSPLILLEDGRLLGPAHSVHADIQLRGQGHFSHWHDGSRTVLIFSTSENSDPRTNARSYVVRTSWLPTNELCWLAAILLVASAGLLTARHGANWLLRATAITAAARRRGPIRLTETQLVHAAWIVATAALLLLVFDWLHFGPATARLVKPQEISHRSDFSYRFEPRLAGVVPLITTVAPSNNGAPRRSRLQLFEDGRALGPAQSVHAEIGASGMGRFSHWGDGHLDAVIFSASDNTDPRLNGRRYTIHAGWQLTPVAMAASLALLAAALSYLFLHVARLRHAAREVLVGWPSRRRNTRIAVAGIAGFAALIWIATFWGKAFIFPDSATYLSWSVLVPLGYPSVLAAVNAVSGSYAWTPVVQILLLAGAIIYVCDALWPLLRVKALATFLAVALVCYTPAFRYSTFIHTESVYTSLILFNVGAAFRLLNAPSRCDNALVLALSAALITFVRPSGYFVPLATLFLLIAWHGMARRLALMAVVPLVGCIVALALVSTIVRGAPGQSLTGYALFPAISHLFEPPYAAPEEAHIAREVYAALQPHREALAKLSGVQARYRHGSYEFSTRATEIKGVLERHLPSDQVLPIDPLRWKNDIQFRFAQATIANDPIGYVDHLVTQVGGTWGWELFVSGGSTQDWFPSQVDDIHPQAVEIFKNRGLDASLAATTPAPERFRTVPGRVLLAFDTGLAMIESLRWVIIAIGEFTLVAVFLALTLRRRSLQWLALGYLGVMIHGAVLLIAAVTVVIPRYTVPIDPMLLVAGVLTADMMVTAALDRLSPSHKRPVIPT